MRDVLLVAVSLRDVVVVLAFQIVLVLLAMVGGVWAMRGAGPVDVEPELPAGDDDPERTVEVRRPRAHLTGAVCACQTGQASPAVGLVEQ